jgi:hypothetical protein
LGPRPAQWAHFFLVVSPGAFAASAALLPSAFAMCCLLLCQSCQLRRQGGRAVLAGAAACVWGWPFAVVALLPVGLGLAAEHGVAECVRWGLAALAATAGPTLAADTWFYEGFGDLGSGSASRMSSVISSFSSGSGVVFSTLNLLRYNLFPRGTGSELYGTEAWHFYLKNLALNFNVALPLSLLALPLLAGLAWANELAVQREPSLAAAGRARVTLLAQQRSNCLAALGWCAPYWLWLAFFSALPHKEERFLFVVYPQLCLAAACAATALQTALLPPDPFGHPFGPEAIAPPTATAGVTLAAAATRVVDQAAQRAAAAFLVPPFGHVGPPLPPSPPPSRDGRQPGLPPSLAALWLLGRLRRLTVAGLAVAGAGLGLGRSASLVANYGAPLQAYGWLGAHLEKERSKREWVQKLGLHDHEKGSSPAAAPAVVVCTGKEWHRFPSHFLLPAGVALAFVDGGFRGQLPRATEVDHSSQQSGTRWPRAGSDESARFFNEVRGRAWAERGQECAVVGIEISWGGEGEGVTHKHTQKRRERSCTSNPKHAVGVCR